MIPKAPKPGSAEIPSHSKLPSAKMRALISLYHQTEKFITPENLSREIDIAFIERPDAMAGMLEREVLLRDLRSDLAKRRVLPKMGESVQLKPTAANNDMITWSQRKDAREQAVINALYGIEDIGKPGLEVLEEEEERIQEYIRRDRELQQKQEQREQ